MDGLGWVEQYGSLNVSEARSDAGTVKPTVNKQTVKPTVNKQTVKPTVNKQAKTGTFNAVMLEN